MLLAWAKDGLITSERELSWFAIRFQRMSHKLVCYRSSVWTLSWVSSKNKVAAFPTDFQLLVQGNKTMRNS